MGIGFEKMGFFKNFKTDPYLATFFYFFVRVYMYKETFSSSLFSVTLSG